MRRSVAIASALLGFTYATPASAVRCKAPKKPYQGECLYPQEIARRQAQTPAPAVRQGALRVDSTPPSEVSVDGKAVGPTPIDGLRLAPGAHEVVLEHPERGTVRRTVEVRAGQVEELEVTFDPVPEPEPTPEPSPAEPETPAPVLAPPAPASSADGDWTGWDIAALSVAALGGVGLIVGGGLAGAAASRYGEADDQCNASNQCTSDGLETRDAAVGLARGADVAFIAGGVLLAGALTLWLVAPEDESTDGEVALSFGPASVGVVGRW